MRWTLRGLVGTALIAVALLLLLPGLLSERRDAERAEADRATATTPTSARTDAASPDEPPRAETARPAPPSDGVPAYASQPLPDDAAPASGRSYDSPIVAGVDGMLAAQAEILGQEPEGLRSTLAEADATLTRIKRSNAEALRDLSRQRRVLGPSSPNLIVVLEQGFAYDDAARFSTKPVWDQLFGPGKRFTDVYSNARGDVGSLSACALEGLPFDRAARGGERVVGPLNLAEALWIAGFRTGAVGDLSPFFAANGDSLTPVERRIDFSMGYLPSDEGDAFWLNGARVDAAAGKSRGERLADEAAYFATGESGARPFALLLSFPGRAAGETDSSHATTETILARLQSELGRSGAAEQTVTIFLGLPGPSRNEANVFEQERALRATLRFSSPGRWKETLDDDRLLTISEFPALVLQFAGTAPPPPWRTAAAFGSKGAADPRAVGWRSPGGTLFRWGNLLIWEAKDGTRSVHLQEGSGWSEDLSTLHPELLDEFDRFVASKSGQR